jgi:hypothetical protein
VEQGGKSHGNAVKPSAFAKATVKPPPRLEPGLLLFKEESVESSDFTDFYPKYGILKMCIRICLKGRGAFESGKICMRTCVHSLA